MDQGYSRAEAETQASFWVARPGTSEHQVGLAVDIVDQNYQILDEKQEDTPGTAVAHDPLRRIWIYSPVSHRKK